MRRGCFTRGRVKTPTIRSNSGTAATVVISVRLCCHALDRDREHSGPAIEGVDSISLACRPRRTKERHKAHTRYCSSLSFHERTSPPMQASDRDLAFTLTIPINDMAPNVPRPLAKRHKATLQILRDNLPSGAALHGAFSCSSASPVLESEMFRFHKLAVTQCCEKIPAPISSLKGDPQTPGGAAVITVIRRRTCLWGKPKKDGCPKMSRSRGE
jgi:hypothetical protein